MKNIKYRVALAFTATILVVQVLISGVAFASSISGGDGYRISPVRTDLVVDRGTSKVVNFYITNVTKATENVQTIVDDFVASSNESGNPSLLLNGQAAPAHGLKQFITVKTPTFVLSPQQQKTIQIAINIPNTVAPGGYYAAVRFAPVGLSGNKNVNLAGSVASLVLVTVPGNYLERMNIVNFEVLQNGRPASLFTNGKNLKAVVSFSNIGQVQEEPFGKFALLKGKKQLTTIAINNVSPPGNVLPNSIRKFTVNLPTVSGFGKYTLDGNFGYGTTGQLLSSSLSFYIIPYYLMVIGVVIILLVLLVIVLLIRRLHGKGQSK